MSNEIRYKTRIARDYVTLSEHREQLTEYTYCLLQTIYDFVIDREVIIARTLSQRRGKDTQNVNSVIQVTGEQATWSVVVDNQKSPNGLDLLDPISITYDGEDQVNYTCTYLRSGQLAQIQVEPYLEFGDISQFEWDENSATRLFIDFTDGPRWWQTEHDGLTRKIMNMGGGYFPALDILGHDPMAVGELQTNSSVDTVPFLASIVDESLVIAIHRRDGLVKRINVPLILAETNHQKLLVGDVGTILQFGYNKFTGRVEGYRTPPDDLALGVL